MAQRVASYAQGLRGHGVSRGDRLALRLRDSGDLASTLLAIMAIGAVAVLLSAHDALQTDTILLSEARALVCEDPTTFSACQAELGGLPIQLLSRRDLAVWRKSPATLRFEDLATETPAFWIMTSGATGHPKAVVHGNGNAAACTAYLADVLGVVRS